MKKQMKKKSILLLLGLLLFSLMIAGCGAGSSKTSTAKKATTTEKKALSGKHYKIALNATFAPFESTKVNKSTGDTTYVGFDIDLVNKMAKDLGFTYTVDNMDFKGLVGALQSKRADFVISGLSPTEERKKNVDFSDPYFNVKTAILYKKTGNYKDVASLKNVKVAAVFGTTYETLAKSSGAETTSLDSSPICMQELTNDRVKAVIMDASQAAVKVKENKKLTYSVIPQAQSKNETFAMAFQKNSKLVSLFNKEIQKFKKDGTINQLTKKWMGKEFLDK